jgi:hypothetical protein
MKKFFSPFFLLLMAGLFALQPVFGQVRGNGNVEEQTRTLPSFDAIVSVSSVDVVVKQGTPAPVVVRADGNLIPYIKTEVKNHTLYVSVTKNVWISRKMEVSITMQSLHKVSLTGSGDFLCHIPFKTTGLQFVVAGSGDVEAALDAQDVDVKVSGSGDVEVKGIRGSFTAEVVGSGDVEASGLQLEKCAVKLSGSGDVELKGRTDYLSVLSVGSGDVDASGLTAVHGVVKSVGSGDVSVHVVESLEAVSNGSGDVKYTGNPTVLKVSAPGSGTVYHR